MAEIQPYDLQALRDFTSLLVAHGRDYAKEAEKDFARDIVRFVRNARILQILKAAGCDYGKLETDLNWLALACHPEDVPDFKPDLKAIRESLQRIEKQLTAQRASLVNEGDSELGSPASARSAGGGLLV